jgi:hypothetical protein
MRFASALLCVALLTVAVGCGGPSRTSDTQRAASPAASAAPAPEGAITAQYRATAERIMAATMKQNNSWVKLQELCDGIGHRLSGSPQMAQAVAWAYETMRREGHENVRREKVMVPHWVRGRESLTMIEPRNEEITMLGLGMSVGTPPEGVTAEVLVVADKDELDAIGDRANGRIVLFNHAMPPYTPEGGTHYGTTVKYRGAGPQWAAEKGAVACLVRSVTAHSLDTPHTGSTRNSETIRRIPAAAVTTEAADMFARMQARGVTPKVTLKMEAQTLPDAECANVVAELRGREKPEEIVIISGHLDSWDTGQGAHDDGGGCVKAMEALTVLRKLDLRPRRTIRVVLWTNEENGLKGAKQYVEDHKDELPLHVAAIESDGGSFKARGYSLEALDDAKAQRAAAQMAEILGLCTERIGPLVARVGGSGADVGQLKPSGAVLMHHDVEPATYFDYHHTPADTIDKVNPVHLSENVAVMAVVAYVIADMPDRLGEE